MSLKLIKMCLVISILIPIGMAFQAPLNVNEVSELTPTFAIDHEWDHTFQSKGQGPNGDDISSVIQSNDGGFVIFGSSSFLPDRRDHWLIQTNSNGEIQWNQTYNLSDWDRQGPIIKTENNGYMIVGTSFDEDENDFDITIIKLNEIGEIIITNTFGNPIDWEIGVDMIPTPGGYVIGGTKMYDTDNNNADFLLIKIDTNGQPLWNRTYGGSDYEFASSLVNTSDGGYLISGGKTNEDDDDSPSYLWVVKTDSEGNSQWTREFGGDPQDSGGIIIETGDGGFLIGGVTKTDGMGQHDFWLIRIDGNGNTVWNKTYGGTGEERINSLLQTSDGGFVLVGSVDSIDQSLGATNEDIWVVKTNSSGEVEWNGRYVTEDQDWAYGFVVAEDGYIVIAGGRSIGTHKSEIRLMKTTGDAFIPPPSENTTTSASSDIITISDITTSSSDEKLGFPWIEDNIGVLAILVISTLGLGGLGYYTSIRSGVGSTAINTITKNTVRRIFNGDTSKYLLVAGNVFRDKKYGSATDIPPELFECKPLLHPIRMAMMKVLIDNPLMTSVELKEYLDLSWSEFRTQMTVLKKLKYVHIGDKIIENTVKQVISVENHGISEFNKLSTALFKFLGSSKYELFLNSINTGEL